uniref:Uncharacterized protein n=2 Tax=Cercopithecinae TaxID=9528 RepID=A0A2K5NP72_CERAT
MDKIMFIHIMCWLGISHSSVFVAPAICLVHGLQILSNQIITSGLKIFPVNMLIMEDASF